MLWPYQEPESQNGICVNCVEPDIGADNPKPVTDIIVNGYLRMPAWGGMGKLNKEQINQLAAYLESIALKKTNWNKN